MKRKSIVLLMASLMALSAVGCGANSAKADEPKEEAVEPVTELSGTQTAVVMGDDWGPAVTKTILHLDRQVTADSVSAEDFGVSETKEQFNFAALAEDSKEDPSKHIEVTADRKVTDAYTCDANGNKSEDSDYVAIEMYYSPNDGSPYCYDIFTSQNTVCDPYKLAVSLNKGQTISTADGSEISKITVDDMINLSLDSAIYPQLEGADLSGTYTGETGHTLTYGSFKPAEDGKKHPLVIWLHGAGEGGKQNEIAVLGNEVSALYGDEFQEVMGGAYVLTPQTETFWLQYNEDGDWGTNPGKDSIYLKDVKGLIDQYIAENDGIDTNRIYIGGCSNGGFMTMDMILNYPDFFAAAFPICEAYMDSGITDSQLKGIKDLPVWFIYASNDDTVVPDNFEIPTIKRLEAMGANVHKSVFDDVHDNSGRFTGDDGKAYQYMGHWSWIYFFNNECEENGVNMWNWLAEQSK